MRHRARRPRSQRIRLTGLHFCLHSSSCGGKTNLLYSRIMLLTGKARLAAAMRHQPTDRVPVMCQLALGHYFLNTPIHAIDIWHSTEGFGEALITLQRKYDFDGILINLPGRDPNWRTYISRIQVSGDETAIHWQNGWCTVSCRRDCA